MIKAEVDMATLTRKLKRASKAFGDTTAQAVARWGVQTSRELAIGTQVFGKAVGKTKKPQEEAIRSGVLGVVHPVTARQLRQAGGRALSSPSEVNAWVEENRGKNGRTRQMKPRDRKVAKKSDVNKVISLRRKKAGMAKGGWLGAGQDIAKAQRGTQRIRIGKNFLGYAQKHSDMGEVKKRFIPFRPAAELRNRAKHTRSSYVMKSSTIRRARYWGLRKTLTWYRRAAKASLDKA